MKSMPNSDRGTPLQGQVVGNPSRRNMFSFVPDPNADTVVTVLLDGDVGDIPGIMFSALNILFLREGIPRRTSGPRTVESPLSRASMRDAGAVASTDSATPASLIVTAASIVAPALIRMSPSCWLANPRSSTSSSYSPGASAG